VSPGTTAAPASRTGCCATTRTGSNAPRCSNIVPTLYRFETIDQKAATGSFHWFFLIQPAPFPELMIGASVELFLRKMLGLSGTPGAHEPEAYAEYLRCFGNPETIRATCDEYRAGAGIDLDHDRADRGRKFAMPLLVLWGERSG